DRLRLKSGVADVEDPAGLAPRDFGPGVIPQRREAAADRLAVAEAGEIPVGEPALRVQPLGRARAVGLLEPAVRVRDARAVVLVDDVAACGGRVDELLRSGPRRPGRDDEQ